MKEKQHVTWRNQQITINKHPLCHTAPGTELHQPAAPIRSLHSGHMTALSPCLALVVTDRVSKSKTRDKTRKQEKEKDGREKERILRHGKWEEMSPEVREERRAKRVKVRQEVDRMPLRTLGRRGPQRENDGSGSEQNIHLVV